MRRIDADALKEAFNAWKSMDDYYHDTDCTDIPFTEAFDVIDNAPTIEERPKGKWLEDKNAEYGWKCSECGDNRHRASSFCPNCGADMRGEV